MRETAKLPDNVAMGSGVVERVATELAQVLGRGDAKLCSEHYAIVLVSYIFAALKAQKQRNSLDPEEAIKPSRAKPPRKFAGPDVIGVRLARVAEFVARKLVEEDDEGLRPPPEKA